MGKEGRSSSSSKNSNSNFNYKSNNSSSRLSSPPLMFSASPSVVFRQPRS